MNEELKIIIKAITDDARKNIEKVKKELGEVEQSTKRVDKAMAAMKKSIAVAVGTITALTTGLVLLGKRSLEFHKIQGQLNSGFQSMGLSAQQASETYSELFGFLGEADRATEAANQLARLTQNTEDLAEWTDILQGVYATFPDSLPVESLAEAANETAKTGKITGALADALNWAGANEEAFQAQLDATNSAAEREALIRSTLNSLYGNASKLYAKNNQHLIEYNKSQAQLDLALAEATRYVVPLMTSLNSLGATLLSVLAPAIGVVAQYMTAFIEIIVDAIRWVGNFFGLFSSQSNSISADYDGYNAAMNQYLEDLDAYYEKANNGAEEQYKQVEKLKRQTMGFDELNIVGNPNVSAPQSGGGGGGGSIGTPPKAPNPSDFGITGDLFNFDGFKDDIEDIKERLQVVLTLIGSIAAALGLFKLGSYVADLIQARDKVKELKGVYEQLKDDLDPVSKEFGKQSEEMKKCREEMDKAQGTLDKFYTILGVFMAVVGALIAIYGYSDAWINGLDWKNFALIIGGAALAVAGLAIAFGSMAGGLTLAFAGVAALVLGIKDFIQNGPTAQNVIMIIAGALGVVIGIFWAFPSAFAAVKTALVAVKGAMVAFNAVLAANPIALVVIAIAALVAGFIALWNNCEEFRNFWINLWKSIQNAFDVAKRQMEKWLDGLGTKFKNFVNTIKSVFSNIGNAIGNAISNVVNAAVKSVLTKVVNIINGFLKAINVAISVINKIPGVNIKKLELLEVPKLATGGIVNGATVAMIGERGREAVLPLENNTEWMDKLANRIASRNNTPSKIVLQVDGRELGWATIDNINKIAEQSGGIPLRV